MKKTNEFAVGAAVLVALAVVIAGALWLGEIHIGSQPHHYSARFRTVDGLQVGNPVTLRGVKVGKVSAIRLAGNDWVETDFELGTDVQLPRKPAVIASRESGSDHSGPMGRRATPVKPANGDR